MEFFGNRFTQYNYAYATTDIARSNNGPVTTIKSNRSDFEIEMKTGDGEVALPENSPFKNWKEARRFAGPLPFTFTYQPTTKTVLIIEGVRQNWQPNPIKVISYQISFLDSLNLDGATLANAFIIENIPYYWKKGKREKWNG